MRRSAVILASVAGLALAAPASADTYAGITRDQAITKAKQAIIALGIAFEGWTPAQAAKWRRRLDAIQPAATHSHCKEARGFGTVVIRAWKVLWPNSDPVFVNRHGIACLISQHR